MTSFWLDRARQFAEQGLFHEVVRCCEQIIGANPDLPEAWLQLAEANQHLRQWELAAIAYEKTITLAPNTALAWRGKGCLLREAGRLEEALQVLDRALQIDPRLSLAWRTKGAVLRDLGRDDAGLECYEAGLGIDSKDYILWENRGRALRKLGRLEDALASYERALALDPAPGNSFYEGSPGIRQERREPRLQLKGGTNFLDGFAPLKSGPSPESGR
jgi:tetratricopeptide (TPR) repeat protein